MDTYISKVRTLVRSAMHRFAVTLNKATHSKVSPNQITIIGLGMHLPIAYLIASGKTLFAAILLVIFGLFDTLDGELARLQKRASASGMLLDASTDRMKEILLYTGLASYFISKQLQGFAIWCVLACGSSLLVSYVKAKGETAVKDTSLSANQVNRLFQDGLMRFEIRMFALVVGLLTNQLKIVIVFIAITSATTALSRLIIISKALNKATYVKD
jgi:CDP-diacylglycerol---glycerol-3-phosphate 3-phosphatidyltransferase